MSKIIRVCSEKNDKLENFALIKGLIAIIFNNEANFAYGYGLKNQGGNDWGDFHIIGSSDTRVWKFSVGNFQPFDGFYDEYNETAKKITNNFSVDDAKIYLEDREENSLYGIKEKYTFDLYNPDIPKVCNEQEMKIFDFEKEDWGMIPNEGGEFYNQKLCFLKDIEGYEEKDSLLWYSLNDCENISLKLSDIEDHINDISNHMSGNIHFIR